MELPGELLVHVNGFHGSSDGHGTLVLTKGCSRLCELAIGRETWGEEG